MVSTSLSGGACSTITTEPIRQVAQPNFPNVPSFSPRKYAPRTALAESQHRCYRVKLRNIPNQHAQRSQRCD